MSSMQPFAIVLAAGTGSRFGATKQLETRDGMSLVARAARLAEHACGARSLLVVGHDWQSVVTSCRPVAGFFAVNDAYREGIGTSIRCGIQAVSHAAGAALLLLADQPLVTPGHVDCLLSRWNRTPGAIVASRYRGLLGPPIVFPRADFEKLSALDGDRGARSVVEAAGDRVVAIDFEAAAVDIDRPEDLAALDG